MASRRVRRSPRRCRIPGARGGVVALGDEQGSAVAGVAAGEIGDVPGVPRKRQMRGLGTSNGLADEPRGFVDGARRHGREPGRCELPDALPVLRVRVAQQMAGGQHARDPGGQRVPPEGVMHDPLGQFARVDTVHGELVLGQFLQPRLHTRTGGKRRLLVVGGCRACMARWAGDPGWMLIWLLVPLVADGYRLIETPVRRRRSTVGRTPDRPGRWAPGTRLRSL